MIIINWKYFYFERNFIYPDGIGCW